MKNLLALLDDLGADVREHVSASITAVTRRLEEFDARLRAIPAGPRGEAGERGAQGAAGDRGAPGEPGARGEAGPAGPQGERGGPGEPGAKGEAGATGPSGPQGERGAPGPSGERGAAGEQGPRGEAGVLGPAGPQGERGEAGVAKDGRDGRDGKDGRDGEPGRDALDFPILESVDETRSYPRGTWACRNGGISRFDGSVWRSVVLGQADEKVEIDRADPRARKRTVTMSDGSTRITCWREPLTIYQGVHKDGCDYEAGDMVTRDGSVWHCEAEKTRSVPGKSDDWKLAVKRGNDGKPGADGRNGETGPQGPAGRDLRYE